MLLQSILGSIIGAEVISSLRLGDKEVDGRSLAEVFRRYTVRQLSLLGSAARGEMRPDSDLDVMVEFDADARIGIIKFESLAEELEALLLPARIEALGSPSRSQVRSCRLCGMSLRGSQL